MNSNFHLKIKVVGWELDEIYNTLIGVIGKYAVSFFLVKKDFFFSFSLRNYNIVWVSVNFGIHWKISGFYEV